MTYIEFFDKTATENICACLTLTPDRVILVGKEKKKIEKSIPSYKEVLKKRGKDTEFIAVGLTPNQLTKIVEKFAELTLKYPDCVFDLTGGDELYLVGAGIVFNKYPDRNINLVRFDLKNGTVRDCDENGEPPFPELPKISVEENIKIYGGSVIYSSNPFSATVKWDNNPELMRDIDKMWEICRRDTKKWNAVTNMLEATKDLSGNQDALEHSANVTLLSTATERLITKKTFDTKTVEALFDAGLLKSYEFNGVKFRVSYKNADIKKCLTKAGQALEMKIYKSALEAKNKNGNAIFNDVMTGVCIDWDGESTGIDTENEIDVMAMQGFVPIFISCKNGYVEIDELYKLSTVAERFGGKYAKKLLVASSLDLESSFGKTLCARAEDMEIRVIGNEIVKMSDNDIKSLLSRV